MKNVMAFCILAVCAALVGVWWLFSKQAIAELPDPVTYCRKSVPAHTVLLIDQTDVLTPRALKGLEKVIDKVGAAAMEGEKISIFRIEEDSDKQMIPLYESCRPPDGSGLTSNVILNRIHMTAFSTGVKEVGRLAANATKSDYSPIVEMLNAAVAYINEPRADIRRKIILFSDMLQNSPRCTDYPHRRTGIQMAECPESPRMDNIDVSIHYILREDNAQLQNKKHKERWEQRIKNAGGRVTLVEEY